ncbi:VG15 protein [Streptomyces harbinensis]|uniref:VG15 protein n=1 Tax=Streptomyces harbinensis TaxID=1176198 RepID=UPI0036AF82DA
MATAEAERLTARYQRQVLRLAGLIADRLRVTALRADTRSIDGWWERISPAVRREILLGQSALAALARTYLRAHAAAEGVRLEPVVVEPNTPQVDTSLFVTGPVAFKEAMAAHADETAAVRAMATQLEGSATRLLMEGPRQTTTRTFQERRVVEGWRRVAAGRGCAFCLMLVGRGAIYSRTSVHFRSHDHCRCTGVLVYRRESEPPQVRRLQEQWREATAGLTGADAVNAWRRYVDEHGL